MTLVQLALALVALVVLVAVARRLRGRNAAAPASVARRSDVPPEVIAAIAGALAVVLERPHRIVDVRPSHEWALVGRSLQHASHALQRR